jgi:hypothetical protein
VRVIPVSGAQQACGGALDVQPRGQLTDVEPALRRRLVFLQRQLQRAVAAELRSAADDFLAQLRRSRAGPDR